MTKAEKIEEQIMKIALWGTGIWAACAMIAKWQRDVQRSEPTPNYSGGEDEPEDGVSGLTQRHKDILYDVQVKLHNLKGDKQYKTLTKAILDDFEWMKHYADVNASYGYGIRTLKKLNRCAEDYVRYYGKPGEEYVDIVNEIGWGECAGDRDYVEKAWSKLSMWANL